jgi:hypothetical protein
MFAPNRVFRPGCATPTTKQDDDQPYRILFGANRVLAGCENHVNVGTTTIQFRDGGSTTAAHGNRRVMKD